MSESLLVRREKGVAWLTLNRPASKNALDAALVQALAERIESLAADAEVRAMVLSGAGGAFCSGADLKAVMADPSAMNRVGEALDQYHRIVRGLVGAPQPVIAMVDGPAVGFGCDLALACDLRVLSTRAYLQEKFVRIGLMPDGGGTLWLTRAVGLGRALELLMLGDRIDAAQALELGLANRVVAEEQLEETAQGLAARLAAGPPLALRHIKQNCRAALAGEIDAALTRERAGQLECLKSRDFTEGVAAWIQKREPQFRGS